MTIGPQAGRPSERRGRSQLDHFLIYREAADMPNAIAVMDQLSDELYGDVLQSKTVDTALPSIVSSFMPKSGGTFLFNRLVLEYHYVEYHWFVTHPLAGQAAYAVPAALRNYLRGGCASHTHFLPTPHNLASLAQAGVRKVWVHVRHPCETVQSAYYHYAGEGQGEGAVALARRADAARERVAMGLDVERGDARKLNAFFREQLTWVVDWLHMWLLCAEANPGFVHFTSHRELGDSAGLLSRVFAAFEVPLQVGAPSPHRPEDRRRLGHANDWRDGLFGETIGEAVALIEKRLAPTPWLRSLCGLDA